MTPYDIDKLPPHDIAAEEAVLGSILMLHSANNCPLCATPHENKFTFNVFSTLKPSDFFREKNAWIYQAMLTLHQSGIGIDEITVAHRLNESGRLHLIGGPGYLYRLLSLTPTPLHLDYYAGIVLDCSQRRQQISKAGQMAAAAYSGISPPTPISGPIEGL